jgi:hypothetical protein
MRSLEQSLQRSQKRSLGKGPPYALAILLCGPALAAAPEAGGRAIYRCTLAGTTTFSDRPCGPAAAEYEPDASRISTYSPPPASPGATRLPPQRKSPRRGAAAAQDQVRHAAECERIRTGLKDVAARMRAGYNVKQGEQLRARKAKLEARRRAGRCR